MNDAPITLAGFFEKVAPGKWATVSGIATMESTVAARLPAPPTVLNRSSQLPQIRLHCSLGECDGIRLFFTESKLYLNKHEPSRHLFVTYRCKNCGLTVKEYAIWAKATDVEGIGELYKFGEHPAFGPPLPSKLIALIRPEYDYFLKGRRAENQGLGIGAFAYYRRVIESQKVRIIDEIIKAAERLSATKDVLEELRQARAEDQFSKALATVKHAMPQGLLINGHNPLTLIHSALSDGLHDHSDEECLTRATNIRIVMVELAERLSTVLRDNAELDTAVARLVKKQDPPLGSTPLKPPISGPVDPSATS
jgi:hypothetical protein